MPPHGTAAEALAAATKAASYAIDQSDPLAEFHLRQAEVAALVAIARSVADLVVVLERIAAAPALAVPKPTTR